MRRNRRAVAESQASKAISNLNQEDPLSKFDRMEEKVERREAQAQASYNVMTSSLSYEMDQLKKAEQETKVASALDELKKELQTSGNE